MRNAQGNCRWAAVVIAAISTMLAAAIAAPAQVIKTLHSFDQTDGQLPLAGLIQAADGRLYGTTYQGGTNNLGTIFRVTTGGGFATLYNFDASDGYQPATGLIQAADGTLYGTTSVGGPDGAMGTVFRVTEGGVLTNLYGFCSQSNCDSGYPPLALIQASDGNFYGTTPAGGISGYGTIFKITSTGRLTLLHTFCSSPGCTDGAIPEGPVVEGLDGDLYGITGFGGTGTCQQGCGTVFKVTTSGALTSLHSFEGTDGEDPAGALVLGSDGSFYGTTSQGGKGGGTVYAITSAGVLSTIYEFCRQLHCPDGEVPVAGLAQGTDGNFYGTTAGGGVGLACGGCGTVFKITPAGVLTTLHSFCEQTNCTDGEFPRAPLIQDTDGNFYGTTEGGGTNNSCLSGCGTVFGLSVGLGPFVEANPASGNVGKSVIILGTSLTGSTSVTFNGTPATFTVESPTAIKTTVPTGATTGPVQVVTPSGTLTSNVNFQVAP